MSFSLPRFGHFGQWTRPSQQGVWHLFDDCFVSPGVYGLGTIGALCRHSDGWNVAVNWYTWDTWTTLLSMLKCTHSKKSARISKQLEYVSFADEILR